MPKAIVNRVREFPFSQIFQTMIPMIPMVLFYLCVLSGVVVDAVAEAIAELRAEDLAEADALAKAVALVAELEQGGAGSSGGVMGGDRG